MKWSFAQIWNQSLEQGRPERKLKPRERIWAGEIGGAFIDRYLKMTAVKPTNPPNARSLRKFEAGNLLEWVVKIVLARAGILQHTGQWLKHQYPGLLPVTGKLDHQAGGHSDWQKALHEIDALQLPEFFSRATHDIVTALAGKYSNGLPSIILEIKSCSSFMFEKYEATGADPRHSCQLFHYLKAKGIDEGHICYISKDDLRIVECLVLNSSKTLEHLYRSDIEQMTHYIRAKETPPKEPELIFDDRRFKFSKNFKVEYSNYLTMLYGYKRPDEYDARWRSKVQSWNNVFKRCVQGKDMTKKNLEYLEEIKPIFPDFDELVDKAKAEAAYKTEEGDDNNE